MDSTATAAFLYSVSEGFEPLRDWIADHKLAALVGEMPDSVTWTRPEGGVFIRATPPPALDDADRLVRSLRTERVAFVPGRAFFADRANGNTLRLSFSCADTAAIDEGVMRLGRLLRT